MKSTRKRQLGNVKKRKKPAQKGLWAGKKRVKLNSMIGKGTTSSKKRHHKKGRRGNVGGKTTAKTPGRCNAFERIFCPRNKQPKNGEGPATENGKKTLKGGPKKVPGGNKKKRGVENERKKKKKLKDWMGEAQHLETRGTERGTERWRMGGEKTDQNQIKCGEINRREGFHPGSVKGGAKQTDEGDQYRRHGKKKRGTQFRLKQRKRK